MGKRNCSSCLYGDICADSQPCEYFCSAFGCDEERSLDETIKNRYFEFREEWFIYTNDDID